MKTKDLLNTRIDKQYSSQLISFYMDIKGNYSYSDYFIIAFFVQKWNNQISVQLYKNSLFYKDIIKP